MGVPAAMRARGEGRGVRGGGVRGGDERRVGAEVGAEVGQSGSGAGSISKVEIEISKDEIDGPRRALAGNGHL